MTRLRALLRSHELALVLPSALIGVAASVAVTVMTKAAMFMHVLIFHLPFDMRLSAADRVAPLAAFSSLMVGGLILGLMEAYRLRKGVRSPVDPIEANALRGGRMSLRESVVVSLQTVISNSSGASVGLEAGYAQIGSGLGSFLGKMLRLRRSDLRLLVGAGAAAGIGSAFGAPLAGAFYAFELILGNYSIASAGPVFVGSLVGVFVTRILSGAPYQIDTPPVAALTLANYPVLMGVAAFSVLIGVAAMRLSGLFERLRPDLAGSGLGAAGPRRRRRRGPRRGHAPDSRRRPRRAWLERLRKFSPGGSRVDPRPETGRRADLSRVRLSRRAFLRLPVHGRAPR